MAVLLSCIPSITDSDVFHTRDSVMDSSDNVTFIPRPDVATVPNIKIENQNIEMYIK